MKPLLLIFLATVACGQANEHRQIRSGSEPNGGKLECTIVADNKFICTCPPQEQCAVDTGGAGILPCSIPAPKPELMDVPAIKIESELLSMTAYRCGGGSWCTPIQEGPPYKYTCADKRRILLTDEGGGKHCILFPKESK